MLLASRMHYFYNEFIYSLCVPTSVPLPPSCPLLQLLLSIPPTFSSEKQEINACCSNNTIFSLQWAISSQPQGKEYYTYYTGHICRNFGKDFATASCWKLTSHMFCQTICIFSPLKVDFSALVFPLGHVSLLNFFFYWSISLFL